MLSLETQKEIYDTVLVIASTASDVGYCKATGKECAVISSKNNEAFSRLRRLLQGDAYREEAHRMAHEGGIMNATNEERFEAWWLENSDEEVKIEYHRCKAAYLAACPQWRQIDEAPKDGTWVLLGYFPDYMEGQQQGGVPAVAWWNSTEELWQTSYVKLKATGPFSPTHWMPLPLPPQEKV